ncbi:MAG: hypothetical protein ABL933_15740 [Methyloglobulus sp.]
MIKIEFDLNDPDIEADYLKWWHEAHRLGMTVEEFVRRAANEGLAKAHGDFGYLDERQLAGLCKLAEKQGKTPDEMRKDMIREEIDRLMQASNVIPIKPKPEEQGGSLS